MFSTPSSVRDRRLVPPVDGPTAEQVRAVHAVAEPPDVVDDAVDELVELVLRRGGWVALVEPGTLAACDGVALATRKRT